MQGVVPAAGKGSRLEELTEDRPKGLIEIDGRPLLSYVFERLVEAGIEELFVVIGHQGEDIIATFEDRYGEVPITYVHQREPLGLAHAILETRRYIDDTFVVLNGDNVFGSSIRPAIDTVGEGVDGAIFVESVSPETARTTGVVEITDDRITSIVEKPETADSTLTTTGCYVLPKAIFHACELVQPSETGEYELSEAVSLLARAGFSIAPVKLDGWRVNVNTQEDVQQVTSLLAD